MDLDYNIEGGDFTHAGEASSHLKKILKSLNLDSALIRRTVVAMYEAEVNVVAHAWSGTIHVNIQPDHIGTAGGCKKDQPVGGKHAVDPEDAVSDQDIEKALDCRQAEQQEDF